MRTWEYATEITIASGLAQKVYFGGTSFIFSWYDFVDRSFVQKTNDNP